MHIGRSCTSFCFSFLGWDGMGLSAPDTSVTNWPYCTSSRWNENCQGKPKCSGKTCLSATLSTTNLRCPGLGSNPACRRGKPVTNSLSYGTTYFTPLNKYSFFCFCNSLPIFPCFFSFVSKETNIYTASLRSVDIDSIPNHLFHWMKAFEWLPTPANLVVFLKKAPL
jgi:hypothetical protein